MSASPASQIRWLIVALVLAVPIFAHGCHGDELDHEPTVVPLNRDASSRP